MCRHLAYLGPPATLASVVLAPARGLYEQSWSPRRQTHGVVNADGFGLGWYPGEEGADPARYRRNIPIWNDPNLPELAAAIRSGAIIAAVRSATPGTGREEAAAAPFRDGRHLFSHNGAVPDWTGLPTDLSSGEALSLPARSDSALLWLLIYRELRGGAEPEKALATVVGQVAAARPGARLNLLLTDGRTIAATRYGDTLWYRTGAGLLVASEPDDEPVGVWHEVPEHTLLLADRAGVVLRSLP
ncbi:MAG TPA: ergothioneine biosynthesis protein EgtC [Actinospica sp.]|nr:ergothioneine biosynthesis protein EgtC [Actinospica sp.]